jgi:hypothetical protein
VDTHEIGEANKVDIRTVKNAVKRLSLSLSGSFQD